MITNPADTPLDLAFAFCGLVSIIVINKFVLINSNIQLFLFIINISLEFHFIGQIDMSALYSAQIYKLIY
ncbi:hypothetical protein DCPSUM001_12900 [Dysgonomonas capnocytophagoides]|nr:hypothetical protein DCPSUM001_12900 [Dysgonomonas capnocytophagoides]